MITSFISRPVNVCYIVFGKLSTLLSMAATLACQSLDILVVSEKTCKFGYVNKKHGIHVATLHYIVVRQKVCVV
jgi:hypothetical protein